MSRINATPRRYRFAKEAFADRMRRLGVIGVQAQAERLGVHRATLSRWCTDEFQRDGIDVSFADAMTYARRAGMNVDRLFVPVDILEAAA